MDAFKLGLLAVSIIAAALTGCSRKNNSKNTPAPVKTNGSAEKMVRPQQTLTVGGPTQGGQETQYTVTMHGSTSETDKTFSGQLATYDIAVFANATGVSESSREYLEVRSLGEASETIIAILYPDSEVPTKGTAYAFKRKSSDEPYSVAWTLEDVDSSLAVDVDTHMQKHNLSAEDAREFVMCPPGSNCHRATEKSTEKAAEPTPEKPSETPTETPAE